MADGSKKKNNKEESRREQKSKDEVSKKISDLGKIAQKMYDDVPKDLIKKFRDTVKNHSAFQKKREEELNQLSEVVRERMKKSVAAKKAGSNSGENAKTPEGKPDSEVVILEQCDADFDTTSLSLTNRRAKFMQHFYKLLIFNHPFKESFVKNNWFIGQVLRYKQEWRPAGFGLGELIKSFSLLPDEETTFEVTAWERTKSEIESITDEEERQTAEQASKSLDTSAVTRESSSRSSWHVEASGSIGFGIGSASLSTGAAGSSSHHAKSMKSSVNESAKKSSSSISQSRSVSIGFSKEQGKESKTIRTLKNANGCHTVTYNFFQLLKIYDLIMTYENSPLALLFPSAKKHLTNKEVMAMYNRMHEAFTDLSSPLNFITQYLKVEPELGRALGYGSPDPGAQSDLSGTALIFTGEPNPVRPERYIMHIMEGLVYFFGYIVGSDLNAYEISNLFDIVIKYVESVIDLKEDDEKEVVDSLEILTPGIYVDSMLGKCSACEPYIQYTRFYDVMLQKEKAKELQVLNKLDEKEVERRTKLLDAEILDPFFYEYYDDDLKPQEDNLDE